MAVDLPLVQCCAPLGDPTLSDEEAGRLEQVFKALADRHRVKILNRLLLAAGEAVCVCDFEALLGLKQPTVSYHLKQLLNAGLVTREKRGSYAYFRLDTDAFDHARHLLADPRRTRGLRHGDQPVTWGSRSHSETCAGCSVSTVTASSSTLRVAMSTSSRSRSPKASSVRSRS
jgi:ArsR family transcriptional regulator, arsenate/arsenite/antimonite-responsive transcriptional repressor